MPECQLCGLGDLIPEGPARARCTDCNVLVDMGGQLWGRQRRVRRALRRVRRRNPRARYRNGMMGNPYAGIPVAHHTELITEIGTFCWPPAWCPECDSPGMTSLGALARCNRCQTQIPRDLPFYVSTGRLLALGFVAALASRSRHA